MSSSNKIQQNNLCEYDLNSKSNKYNSEKTNLLHYFVPTFDPIESYRLIRYF